LCNGLVTETSEVLLKKLVIPLAAVILTRNEERHIAACIESVAWADRVVVLDDYSDDHTVEIAREMGATVIQHRLHDFGQQRNVALEAVEAEWILFVDADERVTSGLAAEIQQVIPRDDIDGWWIPRHNYIWGAVVLHAGWYPDYQMRLLRRAKARYDPTREVHELVILDGQEGHLDNVLVHYNYDSLRQFRAKQKRYTDYDAKILFDRGVRPKPQNYLLQPLRQFKWRYFDLAGYKAGWRGLLLSLLMAYYNFSMYLRLRRLWQKTGL
jgi:glycosyltransferase involved in cell wall biosynthesis